MPEHASGAHTHDEGKAPLGVPRVHLRRTDSTNERAKELALAGAPHGTLVTATEQTAGRGRQGRSWSAPAGSSLLCSLVLRSPPALLSLIAGVAVCDAIGAPARVKWPNDVVREHDAPPPQTTEGSPAAHKQRSLSKLAGILVEGRPQEGWAVLGIGVNVAVCVESLPEEVRSRAASLERPSSAIEPLLADLLAALALRVEEPRGRVLDAWRARDALLGREISWGTTQGEEGAPERGRAQGIDEEGRLLVRLADGATTALSAGEVHIASVT
ncbi:MAG: biotin--[acetyl-CoA-carboxylase] ligase [Solirubrobacteraceae bacterium]